MSAISKETLQAIELLRDENLVWSSDMNDIKDRLADLMLACVANGDLTALIADSLAKKILGTEKLQADVIELR